MLNGRVVFAAFVVLQILDGLITYAAVSRLGSGVEGNPVVATWILIAGAGPALFGAKLVACGCGAVLYVRGVHRILAGLTALYLFGAVAPWLHVLALTRFV